MFKLRLIYLCVIKFHLTPTTFFLKFILNIFTPLLFIPHFLPLLSSFFCLFYYTNPCKENKSVLCSVHLDQDGNGVHCLKRYSVCTMARASALTLASVSRYKGMLDKICQYWSWRSVTSRQSSSTVLVGSLQRGKRLQRCQQGRPSPFVPINVHSYPQIVHVYSSLSLFPLFQGVQILCPISSHTMPQNTYHDHDDDEL